MLEKQLREEFCQQKHLFQKDWESQKNLYDLRIQTLEGTVKQQQQEMNKLRQAEENSSKKAQQLAVKVIESGMTIPKTENEDHAA